MSETVKVKLAEVDDAPAILEFLRQAKTESDAVTIPHLEKVTGSQEAENIKIINESDDCIILLATLGTQIVGLVTVMRLSDEPATGELGVIVAEKYWHQGIGQLLVDEAEYWFENYSSLKNLTLDVFEDNVPAIHLYRKMNFEVREHIRIGERSALQMDYRIKK